MMSQTQVIRRSIIPAITRMKGISFSNVRAFVIEQHGDAAWTKMVSTMSQHDQSELGAVVPVGWYETQLFARLLRKVDVTFGGGNLRLLERVGRFEAEQDFNRVLRLLLRVMTPTQVFKAERRIWSHFQDSGSWTVKSLPKGMLGVLSDWAVDEALCVELVGYLVRLLEFTGGKNVRVTHAECRAREAANCVFEFRWD
jgi:hypothetical protein